MRNSVEAPVALQLKPIKRDFNLFVSLHPNAIHAYGVRSHKFEYCDMIELIFLCTKRRSKGQGVLILGTCDTGKTLMFYKLVYGGSKQPFTVTSVSPNTGDYVIPEKSKTLQMIDLPGHERLRLQMLEQKKSSARGIIYVVDSATIQKDIKEAAEFLYNILSDSVILGNSLPVLVACNKQDQHLVKGASFIEKQLQKEINTLRVTRSAALQQIDSSGNNNTFIGKRDKDFEFSDLKPLRVTFTECSALETAEGAQPGLTGVESWLANLI
ncbi:hypothetical protein FSP39_003675 [Pinctada imbricata]|uniref:Signal recognition particle receptor subunit beta n=1 Tax=Pinctada imbricata TaxID=66713 RepID=A0AA89C4J6_PINIB|nr:hypothetical protein FSP39_003675 [Pinctada imbricata]